MNLRKTLAVLGLALLAPLNMAPTPTVGRNYSPLPTIEHATDCTAASAPPRHYCYEVDGVTTWYCPLSADDGGCFADDWVSVGGGVASSLADGDYTDFSCTAGVCTLDADVVAAAELADADLGDVSVSGGVVSVDANSVALTTDTTGGYAASTTEAGGATSVEANAVGDAGLNITKAFSVGWKAATVDDDIYVKAYAGAATLTSLNCTAVGGTATSFVITADECDANGANCASSGGTVTLSALVTNTADTTFSDAAIDDDDWIRFDVTSLTSAPDYAYCRLEYTF